MHTQPLTAPHSPSQPFTALHSPRTPRVPPVQVQQLSGISNLFTFSAAVVRANGFDDDATAQVRALTLTLTLSHGAGATFLLLTFPLQPSSYY